MGILNFPDSDICGTVTYVDTAQIIVEIDNMDALPSTTLRN